MSENRIRVEWRIEGGQTKGRILEDEKRRRKIVFVDRGFRGRLPRNGEITEAGVSRDTKPEETTKGALLVCPVYAPPAGALSKDEARAKIQEIAKAQLPIFDRGYAEVDLPGWRGELSLIRDKFNPKNEPLSVTWRFAAEDGATSFGRVEMTSAIGFVRERGMQVFDLAQAIRDLGEPANIEASSLSYGMVTWVDSQGGRLQAEACFERALAMNSEIRNFRLDNDSDRVVAEISLFNDKLVLKAEFMTRREQFCTETGLLKRASIEATFASILTGAQRKQVTDLVRTTLHSPAWYQQHWIAQELDPTANWSESAAVNLKRLQAVKEDMYAPEQEIDEPTKAITRVIERIRKLQALNPAYEPGKADPDIYSLLPQDADEVERMRIDNEAKMAQLLANIEEIKHSTDLILELRRDTSFPQSIRSELEKLRREYMAAFQAAEASQSDSSKFLLTRRSSVRLAFLQTEDLLNGLALSRNYEYTLEYALRCMWTMSHRLWPNILKEAASIEARTAPAETP